MLLGPVLLAELRAERAEGACADDERAAPAERAAAYEGATGHNKLLEDVDQLDAAGSPLLGRLGALAGLVGVVDTLGNAARCGTTCAIS